MASEAASLERDVPANAGRGGAAPTVDARVDARVEGPNELAELLGAFNQVTARLERTHDQLRGEVARLRAELSEANAQLERSRRLAALGEMAAGIAHEVRNPLGSIALYARMLKEDLAHMPPQRSLVEKIAGATKALDVVVGDVLLFSREFKVRVEPVDAASALEAALDACHAEMTMGRAGWLSVEHVNQRTGAMPVFHGDPGLVHQALVNVVRNAIEAMRDCPERLHVLRLEAMAIRGRASGEEEVALRVMDSGPGVKDEVIARMFNPFFTTRAAGTGLGLAIVHRIVDAHDGRVQVFNNESGGATVELVFPRTPVRAGGAPETALVEVVTANTETSGTRKGAEVAA